MNAEQQKAVEKEPQVYRTPKPEVDRNMLLRCIERLRFQSEEVHPSAMIIREIADALESLDLAHIPKGEV